MGKVLMDSGFILKKSVSKGEDKLVVVFGQNSGKLWLLAKGAQKITSKRLSSLDSLNYVQFLFTTRNGFNYLKEIQVISSLQSIKNYYNRQKNYLYFCELLDKILPVFEPEPEIFALTKQFIKQISTLESKTEIEVFLLKTVTLLFAKLGYLSYNTPIKSFSVLNHLVEQVAEKTMISDRL